MILNDYNQLIRENFDISDSNTRKFLITLEDAEQNQVLSALASALYDKIVQKVDQIDFGTIPSSRGDITKVDGFENTMECLDIMRRLVIEYKENPEIVDNVLGAIENIRSRRSTFIKGFAMNLEMPILLYNLMVLSIEQSVSFLISVCIQYIKDPETEGIKSALDKVAYKNAKDNLIYNQIVTFNGACATKDLDKLLESVFKNGGRVTEGVENEIEDSGGGVNTIIINVGKGAGAKGGKPFHGSPFKKFEGEEDKEGEEKKPCEKPCQGEEDPQCFEPGQVAIHGGGCDDPECFDQNKEPLDEFIGTIGVAAGIGVAAVGGLSFLFKEVRFLLKVIIPFFRNVVYYFIHARTKVSDYFSIQAQFIEANAYKLQYSTNSGMTDEKKKQVVKKQLKWAERFKSIANKFAIADKKASIEAEKDVKEDEKNKTKVPSGGSSGDGIFSFA